MSKIGLQLQTEPLLAEYRGVGALGLAALMYFTYAQGWLYVVGRALVQDAVLRRLYLGSAAVRPARCGVGREGGNFFRLV